MRLRLLGGFSVELGGGEIALPTRRAALLLAILALRPGEAVSRSVLAELVWGDRPDTEALAALRRTLYEVRHALGEAGAKALRVERERIGIVPEAVWVDVADVRALALRGDEGSLESALALHGGPFLAGFESTSPAADDWCRERREEFDDLAKAAALSLARAALDAGRPEVSLQAARRLAVLDPFGDESCRALMRALAANGRRVEVGACYETFARRLTDELGEAPEPGTRRLRDDLLGGEDPTGRTKPSIVVLPFDNLTRRTEDAPFVDGVTEDVITGLGRFREILVIARGTSFAYRRGGGGPREAGRALGVAHLLEGSVRREGDRLRLTARLFETETGGQIWAEHFDRQAEDVFAVLDELTGTVVATVMGRVRSRHVARTLSAATTSLGVLDLVLQARHDLVLYTPRSLARARELLTRAIARDPRYPPAHVSLSQVHWGEFWIGACADADEWRRRMVHHAEESVRLDEADARTHLQLGFVDLYRDRLSEGRARLEKALHLNPNEPDIPFCIAYHEIFEGRGGEAVAWVERSRRLDPLGHYGYVLGVAHFVAGDYERARAAFGTVRGGMATATAWLAACHARLGDRTGARELGMTFADRMGAALAEAGHVVPESWASYFDERWPFRHDHDRSHVQAALRIAGLT